MYWLNDPPNGASFNLNEMCLALEIYSRKLCIIPLSTYDTECHAVNEIWDSDYRKWIVLDISNNLYWVDEKGIPLSMLEVRDKIINGELCIPVSPNDNLDNIEKTRKK